MFPRSINEEENNIIPPFISKFHMCLRQRIPTCHNRRNCVETSRDALPKLQMFPHSINEEENNYHRTRLMKSICTKHNITFTDALMETYYAWEKGFTSHNHKTNRYKKMVAFINQHYPSVASNTMEPLTLLHNTVANTVVANTVANTDINTDIITQLVTICNLQRGSPRLKVQTFTVLYDYLFTHMLYDIHHPSLQHVKKTVIMKSYEFKNALKKIREERNSDEKLIESINKFLVAMKELLGPKVPWTIYGVPMFKIPDSKS